MLAFASSHDAANKRCSATAPAGLTAEADLANAIHNIFLHQTSRRLFRGLIQKLATGSPSPQYVGRVAAVFNNNGSNMRGDMKAVIRAILNDPEARGDIKIDPAYGKLREPALYLLNLLRAFDGQSDGVYLQRVGGNLLQNVYYSPSVFNYYPPGYMCRRPALGPEFAIRTRAPRSVASTSRTRWCSRRRSRRSHRDRCDRHAVEHDRIAGAGRHPATGRKLALLFIRCPTR
jgi:uncharacterized protein (DUF1800 family)